jgi:hypothetical protein
VGPAVSGSGTIFYDVIEFISSVGKENAFVAFENALWVNGMFGVRVVVADIWKLRISSVDPDEALVSFPKSFFENRLVASD